MPSLSSRILGQIRGFGLIRTNSPSIHNLVVVQLEELRAEVAGNILSSFHATRPEKTIERDGADNGLRASLPVMNPSAGLRYETIMEFLPERRIDAHHGVSDSYEVRRNEVHAFEMNPIQTG